jgi:hypothetical protein
MIRPWTHATGPIDDAPPTHGRLTAQQPIPLPRDWPWDAARLRGLPPPRRGP